LNKIESVGLRKYPYDD